MIDIIEITAKTALGIIALAAGMQGWAWRRTTALERALLILAGMLLVFPSLIEACSNGSSVAICPTPQPSAS